MRFNDYITDDNVIHIDWNNVVHSPDSISEVVTSDDNVLRLTDWRIQRQIGTPIYEVFDTKVDTKILSNDVDRLNIGFKVSGIKYIFTALSSGEEWTIMFVRSDGGVFDDNPFANKKGNSNVGVIISGVFRCIQILLQERDVKYITFGTDDDDLMELYTNMTPYIEKRLPLKLHRKELTSNKMVFQYEVNK